MPDNTLWIDVPDGSEIVMALEVPDGKIVSGHVDCSDTDGGSAEIPDSALRPGPARRAMAAGKTHTYVVRITFASACTATFKAHLEAPGGEPYGDPFVFAPSGEPGSVRLANMVCVMEEKA
jgi:hypothetical protein